MTTKSLNNIITKDILGCLLVFQLFRLILLPFMGLMPQDAYYYMYGQNLDFSYFDHPGMIGYILRFFTEIFGRSVFVIKFADFTITTFTILLFCKFASLFLPREKLRKSVILISSTVFISVLSFNSTPDIPLLFFWTISLIFLYKAIFENKKSYWIFAGVTLGLAFNSKYTAVLLQIGLIIFLIFSKEHRKLLFSKWLWMCLIISFLFSFPVLWWNYSNNFSSFKFQATSRDNLFFDITSFPKHFLGVLGHQTILLLPILCWIFLKFTSKYFKKIVIKRKLPSAKTLFLLSFFAPTFLGFLALTPIYWVKLNWLMPSYITGIILASYLISRKSIKYQLICSIGIHLLLAAQVLFTIVPIKSDDTWIGWQELALEVEQLQKKYPNTFIFSEDNYKTTAALDFYTEQKVYAQNIINLRALQYDFLGDDLTKLNGKNALFLDSDTQFRNRKKNGNYHPNIDLYFDEVTELEPIIIKIDQKKVRKFWVFHCKNYQRKNN